MTYSSLSATQWSSRDGSMYLPLGTQIVASYVFFYTWHGNRGYAFVTNITVPVFQMQEWLASSKNQNTRPYMSRLYTQVRECHLKDDQ